MSDYGVLPVQIGEAVMWMAILRVGIAIEKNVQIHAGIAPTDDTVEVSTAERMQDHRLPDVCEGNLAGGLHPVKLLWVSEQIARAESMQKTH